MHFVAGDILALGRGKRKQPLVSELKCI